jgi:hypothetical protein
MIPEPPRKYGLRDQYEEDFIMVFAERAEFACWKEFEITENKQPKVFADSVVWDTEALKKRMIVQQQGVYLGSVLLFILKRWFMVEPKPGDILWEHVQQGDRVIREGWRVMDVTDSEYVYEIGLDELSA